MYIICFKNGSKIRVLEEFVDKILDIKKFQGCLYHKITDGSLSYKLLVCFSEILYIQPEQNEIKENYYTFIPTNVPNSTGTAYVPPRTEIYNQTQ